MKLKEDKFAIPKDFPLIVCLCGSTRFKREFIQANFQETMKGHIVLTVGWFSHSDADEFYPSGEEKQMLDNLHLRKIELADEVLVIDVENRHHRIVREYIGESTAREIEHARRRGKPIRYWSEEGESRSEGITGRVS